MNEKKGLLHNLEVRIICEKATEKLKINLEGENKREREREWKKSTENKEREKYRKREPTVTTVQLYNCGGLFHDWLLEKTVT